MLAYNDVLDELQDYILDEGHIDKLLKMKLSSQTQSQGKAEKTRVIQKVARQPALFVPAQQDSLFWCFYILKNGDASYETLNNKNSLVAKQQKIELVSVIRKNKDIVKWLKHSLN